MPKSAAILLRSAALAGLLALAACSRGAENNLAEMDNSLIGNGADPALTSALEDQILVDPVSFVASALLVGSIRRPEPPPPPAEHREPVLREIRAGLSITFRDPVLRAFALGQMAQSAMWGVFGAVWILFATQELELGPAAIGFVEAKAGAGQSLARRGHRSVHAADRIDPDHADV